MKTPLPLSIFLLFFSLLFSSIAGAKLSIEPKFIEQDEYLAFSSREDTVVIDVRTQREYKAGHIPGAINIPHKDILRGNNLLAPYKNKNIVFYCHTGVRVGFIINYLENNPYISPEQIYHLRGDFRAWQARGLTIVRP